MLKEGDKVTMLIADGWAAMGWIGTITDIDITHAGVQWDRVQWDNGKLLYHDRKNLKAVNLLYIGTRVMMKISDPWASKDWTGTVISNGNSEGALVSWDAGSSYWHQTEKLLVIESQVNDPNLAFVLYKKGVS